MGHFTILEIDRWYLTGPVLNMIHQLNTSWKVSVFGVFLVRIFLLSDWPRRFTEQVSAFNPNTGKYRPEKLWVDTFYRVWYRCDMLSWVGYQIGLSPSKNLLHGKLDQNSITISFLLGCFEWTRNILGQLQNEVLCSESIDNALQWPYLRLINLVWPWPMKLKTFYLRKK